MSWLISAIWYFEKCSNSELLVYDKLKPCYRPCVPHLQYLNFSRSNNAHPSSIFLFINLSPFWVLSWTFSMIFRSRGSLKLLVTVMEYWTSSLPWWWCRDHNNNTDSLLSFFSSYFKCCFPSQTHFSLLNPHTGHLQHVYFCFISFVDRPVYTHLSLATMCCQASTIFTESAHWANSV